MINIEESIQEHTFMLLETGADISLIKLKCLKDDTLIDDSIKLKLQGINKNLIETIGRTFLTLHLGNLVKEHFFHVVPNNFKIRTDGIIGRDIMIRVKSKH